MLISISYKGNQNSCRWIFFFKILCNIFIKEAYNCVVMAVTGKKELFVENRVSRNKKYPRKAYDQNNDQFYIQLYFD